MQDKVNVRNVIEAVGWIAYEGLTSEVFPEMSDEDYNSWADSQGGEVVEFESGVSRVMQYAKEYGATEEDLKELSEEFDNLKREYVDNIFKYYDNDVKHIFVLFGVESDLSLGVV